MKATISNDITYIPIPTDAFTAKSCVYRYMIWSVRGAAMIECNG